MSDIKLKNKQGEEVVLRGVESLSVKNTDNEIETFIQPNGNVGITGTGSVDVTNYATAQVVDSDLVAGNIKRNVNILGIDGTLDPMKPEQTKTVELDMASGNQMISSDSGKVLTSVTVNKPSTMVPENIKKDINIAGVVGTFEGSGGGGGSSDSGVIFIDYDGEIVEQWDSGDVASKSALPNNPSHTGLTAQGWNWSLADIKSYITNYPEAIVFVGQMYATVSGLTEFDITLTKVTGLTVNCQMSGNKNWGDGTTDKLTSHTYSNYGDYTITCDGTTIPMYVFDQSVQSNYFCTNVRISDSVTSITLQAFFTCISLASITIPDSVTRIGTMAFQYCYSLKSITIPDSVTSIDTQAFQNCYTLKFIVLSNGITSITNQVFQSCFSLASITIPNSVTIITQYAFQNCYLLTSLTMPDSITSIADYAFTNCSPIIKYDFSGATAVPTLSNTHAFYNINQICKIIVPDALYDDWIVAANWSTYANYIYKASEVV